MIIVTWLTWYLLSDRHSNYAVDAVFSQTRVRDIISGSEIIMFLCVYLGVQGTVSDPDIICTSGSEIIMSGSEMLCLTPRRIPDVPSGLL